MGFFDSKMLYAGKYSEKCVNQFTAEDKAQIKSVEVVPSEFGLSACFTLINGYKAYTPMSNTANVKAGDKLDIDQLEIQVLERMGSKDIERIKIKS